RYSASRFGPDKIYITHRPCRLTAEPGLHFHADFDVPALHADQTREKQSVHALEFDQHEHERDVFEELLRGEVTDRPRVNTPFGRQLEPLRRTTAIHAMDAWRGEFVAALRAMAAEQFALGQAEEERRVLFVAVQ